MKIICDTNVWYDISRGARDPATLKMSPGDELVLTPISALELISKITPKSFLDRQGAARAIVKYADSQVLDPERHLASLWGTSIGSLKINWMDAIQALASARDLHSLSSGVADFGDGVIRSVDQVLATTWRTAVYDDFSNDMVTSLDPYIPGYSVARSQGKMVQASKELVAALRNGISNPQMVDFFIRATFVRLQLHVPTLTVPPTIPTVALMPYAMVYQEYYLSCCTRAPQPNDWGDLEMFLYCQNDTRLLTAEKKWIEIARDAGQQKWLF